MTDDSRQAKRRSGGANDAIMSLYDQLEDLYSILETLDELGIKNREELIGYIDTLDAELNELEAAERS